MQARIGSLEGDLDATRSRGERLQGELHSAHARLSDLTGELDSSRSDLARFADLRDDLHSATSRAASLEAELAGSVRRVGQFEAELAEVSTRLAASEARSDDVVIDLTEASLPAESEQMDNLLLIDGIGPKLEQFLHRRGITTFRQIAELDEAGVAQLQSELPQFPGRIEREQWVPQARRFLTEGAPTPASHERDDLKIIKGIGPVLERWLHGQQIYRFAQLAALDDAGIAALDGALEDFPGRIVREAWVPQARELIESAEGARQ